MYLIVMPQRLRFDHHDRLQRRAVRFASGLHEATLAVGFTAGSLGGGYAGATLGVRTPFEIGIGAIACIGALQLIGYIALRNRAT